MPISGYFDIPFGLNGNLTVIPDPTQGSGAVSYNQGWPVAYSTPVGSGGFNIPRAQMNQLFYDITSAIQIIQQGSPPAFITTTMNGGSPYVYPAGAIVSYSGTNYQSLVGSNADTPPSSKWAAVVVGTKLLAANNLSDVVSASTSRTNLGLGTAAVQNVTYFCQVANNLSDVASASTARTNLGLGTAAVENLTSVIIDNGSGGLTIGSGQVTGSMIASSAALAGSPTTTTQSTSDSSTKIATTAFVKAALLPAALAVGSYITARGGAGVGFTAGTTVAAATLTGVSVGSGNNPTGTINFNASGDTLAGTWNPVVTAPAISSDYVGTTFQRVA